MDKQGNKGASRQVSELAQWKKPELRRMAAGSAEVAFRAASDGATSAS